MNKLRHRKLVIFCMALAIAAGGIYGSLRLWGSHHSTSSVVTGGGISTVLVERGDVVQSLTVYGEVVPKQEYTFAFDGDQIKEIYVKQGERVDKDQILVELNNTKEKLALMQAEDSLAEAKAEGIPRVIQEKEMAYQLTKAEYAATTLRAPFAGVVSAASQAVGSSQEDKIVLIDTSELFIEADVDQLDIPRITPGEQAIATVDAFSDRTWQVKIVSVGGMAEMSESTSTVAVRAKFPNPESSILPGFTAQMEIITSSATDVLRIPISALIKADGSWAVMKVIDGKQQQQSVKVGVISDQYAEVKSGLNEGDKIVLYPTESKTADADTSTASASGPGDTAPPGFPGMP